MQTTLNKIRQHSPCQEGWTKLLKHLNKTKGDDDPLALLTILDSNGLDDALWCMRAVDGFDSEIRLYAVWCVRQVQHLMTDKRSFAALDIAEKFANGEATEQDLAAASDAAWSAAWSAASDAARAAARAAAWSAASDAARAVARAVAWSAARAVAWSAASDAARADQEKELRRILSK